MRIVVCFTVTFAVNVLSTHIKIDDGEVLFSRHLRSPTASDPDPDLGVRGFCCIDGSSCQNCTAQFYRESDCSFEHKCGSCTSTSFFCLSQPAAVTAAAAAAADDDVDDDDEDDDNNNNNNYNAHATEEDNDDKGNANENVVGIAPHTSQRDPPTVWAAYLEASKTLANKPPIRWLHVPKAGSSFWYSYTVYACEPAFIIDHPYLGQGDPRNHCPRARLPLLVGHKPIEKKDLGVTVGMFRHPRSRMASHCRVEATRAEAMRAKERGGASTGDVILEATKEYIDCVAAHSANNHLGVMTRMVAGKSCGGAVGCNSKARLEPITPNIVVEALDRIAHGALLFAGVTDNWNDSVELFHAMILPGVPVFSVELQNMHPSTTNRNASIDLERQESSFAQMFKLAAAKGKFAAAKGKSGRDKHGLDPEGRLLIEHDPDLIIYARIRQLFCANYWTHVAAPRCSSGASEKAREKCAVANLPSTCHGDLGPLPTSYDFFGTSMRSAAKKVIKAWGLEGREDVSVDIVSGAGISVAAMFQSMPKNFNPKRGDSQGPLRVQAGADGDQPEAKWPHQPPVGGAEVAARARDARPQQPDKGSLARKEQPNEE